MFFKKSSEYGRSMIEMLGVLAIVGVLSIGAIAGFQKAMIKHKINQVTDEFSQFLSQLLIYSADFRRMHRNNSSLEQVSITGVTELFLPSKWKQNGVLVYDSMNNKIRPFIRNDINGVTTKFLSIDYDITKRTDKKDLCIALYQMVKPYYERIFSIYIWRQDIGGSTPANKKLYGQNYCTGQRVCLQDLMLSDIITQCSVCADDDKFCTLVLLFPL